MLSSKFPKERHVNSKKAIVPLIKEVCIALDKYSPEATQLLLGTAAAESNLIHRAQIGGGPACGLWQVEPKTAIDIFDSYLEYRMILYSKLLAIWFDLSTDMVYEVKLWMREHDIAHHLQYDDAFACAMARIHYLRVPTPIPTTLEGQAVYWKQHFNTPLGKGTIEYYLKQWEACECEELLDGYL